jgi:starch synthase
LEPELQTFRTFSMTTKKTKTPPPTPKPAVAPGPRLVRKPGDPGKLPLTPPAPEPELAPPAAAAPARAEQPRPAPKADAKPDVKRAPKPDAKRASKPDAKPDEKRASKPNAKPDVKPAAKPDVKTDLEPDVKPASTLDATAASKPDVKRPSKPVAKRPSTPVEKPAAKPDERPAAKPEATPAATPGVKPAAKPDVRPAATPESRPRAKPATKPRSAPALAPEPVAATPVLAPEPRPEPPPAPKLQPRLPAAKTPRPRASADHEIAQSSNVLDILMVTSEARPYAKTGGLADVCGALPLALARLGHRVTIVLPRYRGTQTDGAPGTPADVSFGDHHYPVRFIEQRLADGVTAVLVDAPALYDRDGLYGDANGEYGDNAFRFAVLCRGALEYARLRGTRPSVIHAHDWQAGLTPVYARTALRDDPVVGGVRCVMTIHNLAFQGQFDPAEMPWIGLGRDLFTTQALEFWGRASSLKGGVLFSDKITTVSPTYAREIMTPEYGFGFNGILASRASDVVGITNGIDTETWNPATDPFLPVRYDAGSIGKRADVKRALLEYVGLPGGDAAMERPAIGMVTRLTHQKGCDLVASAGDRLMAFDATWIVLGSGDAWCEDAWRQLASRHPDRVAARIGFDDRLAHLIEGGSDMFLMPSWYEPCGLNQMYSQRYGSIPIVRATGGLQDTVIDLDEMPGQGTGVKFRDYTADGLVWAVDRALATFANRPVWKTMQQNAMKRDFSWDVSAREYVKVYAGT